LILLLVSTIVATGMPAAKNAYEKIIVAANAQVLLSTSATALRDELGTSWDVKIDDDTSKTSGTFVTYNSSDSGAKSKIFLNGDENKIYIQEYVKNEYLNVAEGTSIGNERLLVSDKAATDGLAITYSAIEKSNDGSSVIISGLAVNNKEGREMAILGSDLTIPVLSFAPVSAG
jgi:hypothetical protein